ncbi:hypothetical protein ACHAW6_013097 [Cyclotella cf. meneghiniana]
MSFTLNVKRRRHDSFTMTASTTAKLALLGLIPTALLISPSQSFLLSCPNPPSSSSTRPTTPLAASLSTATGEADRAFRLGIQLEKSGLSRSASAAFHEAATLYQCYLDFDAIAKDQRVNHDDDGSSETNRFRRVTALPDADSNPDSPDIRSVLAYACIRLAHLSHDSFGDSRAATRLYRLAKKIDPVPSAVAFHGIGTSIEASLDYLNYDEGGDVMRLWRDKMEKAVDAYRDAVRIGSGGGIYNNGETWFHLAVALESCSRPELRHLLIVIRVERARKLSNSKRLGDMEESEKIMETLRRGEANLSCLVDSWGYVRWHTRRTEPSRLNLHRGTRAMLQIALDAAQPLLQHDDGLVCEFGVASGRSLRMTQEMLPLDVPIHGFDTFTGLPVAWGNEPAGTYSTGGVIPKMEGENVHFHKGLFKDTIPTFLSTVDKGRPLAYANIDCDLYGSTRDVLEACHGRIIPGTVLVFDEYLCHPSWRQDEFRCWRECCKRFGWQYEYLAFSLSTKQAVVRVTS